LLIVISGLAFSPTNPGKNLDFVIEVTETKGLKQNDEFEFFCSDRTAKRILTSYFSSCFNQPHHHEKVTEVTKYVGSRILTISTDSMV